MNENVQPESPVEIYVRSMLEQSKNSAWLDHWKEIPGRINDMPRYQYFNADGMSVVLVCMEKNDDHVQYKLRCRKNGKHRMSSTEWTADGVHNSLGTIYDRITQRKRMILQERYAERAGCFVKALIRDAGSTDPALRWVPDFYEGSPAYRANGLGDVDRRIWIIQTHEGGDADPCDVYAFRYERDGEAMISFTETASAHSDAADLCRLYRLVRRAYHTRSKMFAETPEVDDFIAENDCRHCPCSCKLHGADPG